ncbi:MAG TPA: hypothetical protein VIC34_10875 [Croceibacterium sp.]|jgi:hypothetical protein
MRAADPKHLLRAYRDLALLDRDDQSCGVVDDIEMAESEPGIWEMTALLVGPGAWARRRPRWLTALLPGHRLVRVEAADVASTGSAVRLLKKAEELGLAKFEQRLLRAFGTN